MGKVQVKQLREFIQKSLDLEAVKGSQELIKLLAEASTIADAFEHDDNEQSERYSSLQKDYIDLVKSYGTGTRKDDNQEGQKEKSLEELFKDAESQNKKKE